MKIAIIGATGKAGQDLFKEATRRGHETTAIVRNAKKAKELLGANIKIIEKDVFSLNHDDLRNFDAIVIAYATEPTRAYLQVDLTTKLISFFRNTEKPHLIFILGAGSLQTGADKHLFVDDLKNEFWHNASVQQVKQLKFLREVENVNWTGVSPSVIFEPGPAKNILLGKDDLLYNAEGQSRVSTGTMAVAILNEIEKPAYIRQRFTVADN